MKIKDKLKKQRRNKGWSQLEAAKRAGLEVGIIKEIENGEIAEPDEEILEALSKAFEVSFDDISEGVPKITISTPDYLKQTLKSIVKFRQDMLNQLQIFESIEPNLHLKGFDQLVNLELDPFIEASSKFRKVARVPSKNYASLKSTIERQNEILKTQRRIFVNSVPTENLLKKIHLPILQINKSLTIFQATIENYNLSKFRPLFEVALKSIDQYRINSDKIISHLEKAENDKEKIDSAAALEHENQLLTNAEISWKGTGKLLSNQTLESTYCFPYSNNLFSAFLDEYFLITIEASSEKYVDIGDLTSVQINNLALQIAQLIFKVNETRRMNQDREIFINTDRNSYLAPAILPQIVATSEKEGKQIADILYFMLYEGTNKLRNLSPFLYEPELQPFKDVKKLRS